MGDCTLRQTADMVQVNADTLATSTELKTNTQACASDDSKNSNEINEADRVIHVDDVSVVEIPLLERKVSPSSNDNMPDNDAKNEKKPGGKTIRTNNTPRTKLPKKQVFLIGIVLFSSTLSMRIIFPFLAFMVASFFPDTSLNEIGYYAVMVLS